MATGTRPAFSLIISSSDLVNLKPISSDCFSVTGFAFLHAAFLSEERLFVSAMANLLAEFIFKADKLFLLTMILID